MAREEMKYNQLFAGEVNYITPVAVASGSFAKGDLLATTDGKVWAKATAVALANYYGVCAEDITLDGAGVVVVYREGYFNADVVKVNGAKATAEAIEILKTKNIFIKHVG